MDNSFFFLCSVVFSFWLCVSILFCDYHHHHHHHHVCMLLNLQLVAQPIRLVAACAFAHELIQTSEHFNYEKRQISLNDVLFSLIEFIAFDSIVTNSLWWASSQQKASHHILNIFLVWFDWPLFLEFSQTWTYLNNYFSVVIVSL